MELEIVTDTGAVERIAISNYGEPTLLNKGTSAYAFSFGLPQSFEPGESFLLVNSPWYQRSLSLSPVASGYYQKGIGDNITANVNLHSMINGFGSEGKLHGSTSSAFSVQMRA